MTLISLRAAVAALALVSPGDGEVVVRLPDPQRTVMLLETYDERLEWCRNHGSSDGWRKSQPLVLKWRATADEKGPWRISVGKSADLSGAQIWYLASGKADETTGKVSGVVDCGDGTFVCEVPRANLEVGETYHWRVDCRGRCDDWSCGPDCACAASKCVTRSSVGQFRTESLPPRWIALEGRVANVRDLGGWKTTDGYRVRQGLAFRGQGLNDNSVNGEVKGPNRLMVEDVNYLVGRLGIKTDLDLRAKYETADLVESPLAPSVFLVLRSSMCYRTLFDADGKRVMAENFRLFCRRENYPVYFHCIGGADRTGSLAYVLNGVLGVSRHDLEVDWESTFYPRLPELRPGFSGDAHWRRLQHLTDGFLRYGDANASWRHRIELYLLDCGVTLDEIRSFREIMLEKLSHQAERGCDEVRPHDGEILRSRAFAAGSRVAFVGDSITHHGEYLRYLNLFYATRFPGSGIRLFNCGVNGDTTCAVQMRLEEDVCARNPTDVSVMLGMNDAVSDTMADFYGMNLRKLVTIVRKRRPDVRFHWMLPTIYDSSAAAGTTNNQPWRAERVNGIAVPAMRRLAEEMKGAVLDVNGDMRTWTARLQAENPKCSILSSDRCHPDRRGGFFIAWSYLVNQRVEPCLDRIERDAAGATSLSFTLTEKALPYPVDPAVIDMAVRLPLDLICCEKLRVVGLAEGSYVLSIDGNDIGRYSSEELAHGIDLSRNVRTPQYRQAMEVMRLVDARNEAEVRYRNLVWVWKMLRLHGLDKKGAADVRAFIESRPERERKVGYFKHLPEWVEWWPRRAELLDNLERQMREIERVAQPVAHAWSLIRSDEQQEDHGNIGL